jgi:hypothetical protein
MSRAQIIKFFHSHIKNDLRLIWTQVVFPFIGQIALHDTDAGSTLVLPLFRRLAVPPAPDTTYNFHRGTGIDYDVVTGAAETCMLHFVENNIGYLAVNTRIVSFLATTTDGLKGPNMGSPYHFGKIVRLDIF